MLKILPLLALFGFALAQWWFSTWRLKRELAERSCPLDHPDLEAAVRRLGRAVGIEHLRAHVYDVAMFNGLAAPDGRVFITRGVLDAHRRGQVTTSEAATIVAHELGHVALGHSRRRMLDWTGQSAARWALAVVLGRFLPGIGPWIASWLASLLAARLSRQDEYEADAYAAALLRKAGVTPEAQASLLRKLDGMAPRGANIAWLMSHPPAKDRAAAIKALQDGWDMQEKGGAAV